MENGIQKDLRTGDIGEQLVTDILCDNGFNVVKNNGIVNNLSDYDLAVVYFNKKEFINSPTFTIEVKYDVYSEKSGNIAIEFWNTNSDKPSGIGITKADLWCVVTPIQGIWIANTNRLKKYILDNLPERTILSGGDGNANFYLYKMDKILPDIFVRCDILSKSKLHKTLVKLLENGV